VSSARVTAIAVAPVKGMRLVGVEGVELQPSGPVGDREVLVVDATSGDLLLTTRTPRLLAVAPSWDPGTGTLRLRFPDGSEVEERLDGGTPATTRNYEGRPLAGARHAGPAASALSAHLGRKVALLRRAANTTGADDAPVSLMSRASLDALAPALDGTVPDPRRFRMTLTIDGVAAWEEHGWAGRTLTVGEAQLQVIDPIPRCVVTTRDPDSGRRDVPALKALAQLRGPRDVTFGIWCAVRTPGRVRVGDALAVR
jgi:uncharacterized protein YcbX